MTDWQPIEIAPNGVVVLVWHEKYGQMTAFYETDVEDDFDFPRWVACPQKNFGSGFANWVEDEWLIDNQNGVILWQHLPQDPF